VPLPEDFDETFDAFLREGVSPCALVSWLRRLDAEDEGVTGSVDPDAQLLRRILDKMLRVRRTFDDIEVWLQGRGVTAGERRPGPQCQRPNLSIESLDDAIARDRRR
jgi:hypothetical protein